MRPNSSDPRRPQIHGEYDCSANSFKEEILNPSSKIQSNVILLIRINVTRFFNCLDSSILCVYCCKAKHLKSCFPDKEKGKKESEVMKQQEQHCRENISRVQSSEYCEIVFIWSKGTVMSAGASIFMRICLSKKTQKTSQLRNHESVGFLNIVTSHPFPLLLAPNLTVCFIFVSVSFFINLPHSLFSSFLFLLFNCTPHPSDTVCLMVVSTT